MKKYRQLKAGEIIEQGDMYYSGYFEKWVLISCHIGKTYIPSMWNYCVYRPLEKEISVEDMQKIVDANEKLVKELKDGSK